ncbi:MAG: hypothetical protein WB983_16765, partial [Terriglobales bacterium]
APHDVDVQDCILYLLSEAPGLYAKLAQKIRGEALVFEKNAEHQMVGTNVAMREAVRLLGGKLQNVMAVRGERKIDAGRNRTLSRNVRVDAGANLIDGTSR